MHFHLPKPLHGWREFAGEVGIIVIGVLIALGAEQVVESFHWKAETAAARQALNSDVRSSLSAARWRKTLQPCVDRRLTEIATIFRRHAAGEPATLSGAVGRPVELFLPTESWDVSVSSQAVSHMRVAERLSFGGAFHNYENLNDALRREQEAWLKLALLDDPTILSEGDWTNLHAAYAEAKTLNMRVGFIADWILSHKSLGQAPSTSPAVVRDIEAANRQFCTPLLGRT
jgi:hypothetical protein